MNEIIVQFNNVTKEYPSMLALSNITFSISKGKIHGFLGPNGAGKSTTMKILAGLIPNSDGEVLFNNENLQNLTDRSKIAYLPELPALYNGMSVVDYLSFIYQIYFKSKVPLPHLRETIEICGIATVQKRMIGHLSKGFKQKVGIAQALISNPELIILDEPNVGLDPKAQADLRSLLNDLKEKHTIFLSSHLLHDVSLICDEITLINHGKIIQSGDMQSIINQNTDTNKIEFICRNWTSNYKKLIEDNFSCKLTEKIQEQKVIVLCRFDNDIKEDEFLTFLIHQKLAIIEFKKKRPRLEDVFFEVTKT